MADPRDHDSQAGKCCGPRQVLTLNQLLRRIPSVDQILRRDRVGALLDEYSRELVLEEIHRVLDTLRAAVLRGPMTESELDQQLDRIDSTLRTRLTERLAPSLRKVINASGVILHTNLGRAPLPAAVVESLAEVAASYSNLEYDLSRGKRGHRDFHFETRIARLLSCEAATVCNNNAAAIFLILNTLAFSKKVLVSRGELVEIGGSFRIPSIMERSGAILCEVGTTNRTRVSDYRDAMDENVALILRVHPSNYRITGFAKRPDLRDLAKLAQEKRIPFVEDAGSGYLFPTSHPSLRDEPSIQGVLAAGVDLTCFSGDKLLGGPQAGIIVGKKKLVEDVRRNPLMRVCRVDKLTYAALDAVLRLYERGVYREVVPVYQMLFADMSHIRERAARLRDQLGRESFDVELRDGYSVIGGGAAPGKRLPTCLLAIRSHRFSVNRMEEWLRSHTVPIVARVEDERLVLDLRTVFPSEEPAIIAAFASLAAQ